MKTEELLGGHGVAYSIERLLEAPRHPVSRGGLEGLDVVLDYGQILVRIRLVQLAGRNDGQEDVADFGTPGGLEE